MALRPWSAGILWAFCVLRFCGFVCSCILLYTLLFLYDIRYSFVVFSFSPYLHLLVLAAAVAFRFVRLIMT